jgi:hypothetical protein
MEFHVIHSFDPALERKLDRLIGALEQSNGIGDYLMATLDDLTAQVTANTSVEGSALTLIQGLADQLRNAGTDSGKLAALQNQLKASADKLAEAVATNTPAYPSAPAGAPVAA